MLWSLIWRGGVHLDGLASFGHHVRTLRQTHGVEDERHLSIPHDRGTGIHRELF